MDEGKLEERMDGTGEESWRTLKAQDPDSWFAANDWRSVVGMFDGDEGFEATFLKQDAKFGKKIVAGPNRNPSKSKRRKHS